MKYWLTLFLVVVAGCDSPVKSHNERVQRDLAKVTYDNGISVTEAQIIGDAYVAVYGSQLRGSPHVKVHRKDDKWVGDVYEGVAVSPMPAKVAPIEIDAQTGQVSWENGPTVDRIDFSAAMNE